MRRKTPVPVTDRQPSYSPPYSPPRLPRDILRPSDRGPQNCTDAAAAAALDLLRRAPEDVLARGRSESSPPAGAAAAGRRGRPSAAQLARERYAQMLQEAPPDLLDLDSPVSGPAQPGAPPGVPPGPAAAQGAALPAAGPQADLSGGPFPGETVLARCGPDGRLYRARVVQAYMRQGASLVDVVWLRPQAGASEAEAAEYLIGQGRPATLDETQYQNGLQVGVDVHRSRQPPDVAMRSGGPQGFAPPARAVVGGPDVGSGALMPDLLDLQADSPVPVRVHASSAAAAGLLGAPSVPASGLPMVPGSASYSSPAASLGTASITTHSTAGGFLAGMPAQLPMGAGTSAVAGVMPAGVAPAASAAAPMAAEPFGFVAQASGARYAPDDVGA